MLHELFLTTNQLIAPVASLLISAITGKEVMRVGKGLEGGFLSLLAFPLMMKVLRKGVRGEGKGYNSMDQMDKIF